MFRLMKCNKATFAVFVFSCLMFNCLIGAFAQAAVSQAEYEACKSKKCVKGSANYEQCKIDCGYNGK